MNESITPRSLRILYYTTLKLVILLIYRGCYFYRLILLILLTFDLG